MNEILRFEHLADYIDLPRARALWARGPRTDAELYDLWLIASLGAWLRAVVV